MTYQKVKYDPLGNLINTTQDIHFSKKQNTKHKRIELRKETGDSYEES